MKVKGSRRHKEMEIRKSIIRGGKKTWYKLTYFAPLLVVWASFCLPAVGLVLPQGFNAPPTDPPVNGISHAPATASLEPTWNRTWGVAGKYDDGEAVALDDAGNVFLGECGWGSLTSFVIKYDPTGTLLWSVENVGEITGIATQSGGSLFLAGDRGGISEFGTF